MKSIKIILKSLPPSLNAMYKIGHGRIYKSEAAKVWQEEAGWTFKQIYKQSPMKVKELILEIHCNKNRDIDNFLKCILDAGNKILWNDDSELQKVVIYKIADGKNYIDLTIRSGSNVKTK